MFVYKIIFWSLIFSFERMESNKKEMEMNRMNGNENREMEMNGIK